MWHARRKSDTGKKITGNEPVTGSKLDVGVPQWKCCINCRVAYIHHMHCVGGKLEGRVITCIA